MMMYEKKRICIICEGYEETEYLQKLIDLDVFHKQYIIVLINVKGNKNIYSRYVEKYQSDSFHCVLIFCDTEKTKDMTFKNIKDKLNAFHQQDIASDIVIFGNPCTMQIILSHFKQVKLKVPSKRINSKLIKDCLGIKDYKASKEQRKALFSKIKKNNYKTMKENLLSISEKDKDIPSTNFLNFLNHLENENDQWIDDINDKLF